MARHGMKNPRAQERAAVEMGIGGPRDVMGHLVRQAPQPQPSVAPSTRVDLSSLFGRERTMPQDKKHLGHRVFVLVGGDLAEAMITARGSYLYTCDRDEATIHGALVEDRYMPRKNPVRLERGDTFEVEPDDVYNAFSKVDPIEQDEALGLQLVHARAATANDVIGLPDTGEVYYVAAPTVLLGPAETPEMWADRTYTACPTRRANDYSFERDLVLDSPLGRYRLVACRPAGLPDEAGVLPIRFRAFEPLDLRAQMTEQQRQA